MSRTPCLTSFFGIGSIPHSGMPGRRADPRCAGRARGSRSRRDRRVDARLEIGVVVEDQRRPGMLQEFRRRRRRLLSRSPVARDCRAARQARLRRRSDCRSADHVVVVDGRAFEAVLPALPLTLICERSSCPSAASSCRAGRRHSRNPPSICVADGLILAITWAYRGLPRRNRRGRSGYVRRDAPWRSGE